MIEAKCLSMMGGEELLLLKMEASDRNVVLPKEATTRRYGITLKAWLLKLQSQGWVCPLCKEAPTSGKFVTDHYHQRKFAKLPPAERAKCFRGCLCTYDNFRTLRALTLSQAKACVAYLENHEAQKP